MKFSTTFIAALASISATQALLIPSDASSLARRDLVVPAKRQTSAWSDLWKRKGGGGKGGSSSSSSMYLQFMRRSIVDSNKWFQTGSSSSSSSSGSSGSRSGSSSNAGGATSAGSGAPRSYGGGRYYGGGATAPYTSGGKTPKGLAPVALLGVGALVFFPGLWLYGAYSYPYSNPYRFYNQTARQNQTRAVDCLCQQYSVCGCDDNDDTTYLDGLVGNGSSAALNQTLVRVANVNGTDTLFINGTLPNGTTASGGTDTDSASSRGRSMETAGWCVIGGAISFAMWLL